MAIAFIGVGSNLQDPYLQVNTAILNLNNLPETRLITQSSLYYSSPQGPQDQPDFVNAVAKIDTSLEPLALLSALQSQELTQGKLKLRHWGERLIDLDILLFDDLEVQSDTLIIPHAQLHLRDFALLPLAEIEPKIHIPNQQDITSLIEKLTDKFVKRKSNDIN